MLGLSEVAEEAWADAALLLPAGWAEEAAVAAEALAAQRANNAELRLSVERSLDSLDEEVVRRQLQANSQLVGDLIQERLLSGVTDQSLQLTGELRVAELIAEYDPFLLDVVSHLRDSSESDLGQAGLALWREAKNAYELGEFTEAADGFASAWNSLREARSPFELEARVYVGVTDLRLDRSKRAVEIFESIWREAERYPGVRGHAAWMLGLTHDSADRHAPARTWFQLARGEFEKANEQVNLAAIDLLIADDLDHVGRVAEAWSIRADALKRLDRWGAPPRRFTAALHTAQDLATNLGRPHVAAVLGEEILARNLLPNAYLRAFMALRMAEIARKTGNNVELERWLASLDEQIQEIDTPADVEWLSMESQLLRLYSRLDYQPQDVLPIASRIASRSQELQRNRLAVEAMTVAGRAAAGLGQFEMALRSLKEASGLTLMSTEALSSEDSARLIDQRRAALEALVDLTVEQLGRPLEALGFVETWLGGSAPVEDLRSGPGDLVIAFFETPDGVHRWWIDEDSIGHDRLSVDRLAMKTDALLAAIENSDKESQQRLGIQLFQDLLGGLPPRVAGAERRIFRPDGTLHRIPWGALWEPNSALPLAIQAESAIAQTVQSASRTPLPLGPPRRPC